MARGASAGGSRAAVADADNDGDVDVAVNNNASPLQLWANASEASSWLGVRLRGAGSNSDAVGAMVELVGADGGRQGRWVLAGGSYQSSSDRRVHFGFGKAHPDKLVVNWPSGRRQIIVGVPVARVLVIGESLRRCHHERSKTGITPPLLPSAAATGSPESQR